MTVDISQNWVDSDMDLASVTLMTVEATLLIGFLRVHPAASLSELALGTALPRSTADDFLRELQRLTVVTALESGKYYLNPGRLYEIFDGIARWFGVSNASAPQA